MDIIGLADIRGDHQSHQRIVRRCQLLRFTDFSPAGLDRCGLPLAEIGQLDNEERKIALAESSAAGVRSVSSMASTPPLRSALASGTASRTSSITMTATTPDSSILSATGPGIAYFS